MIIILLLLGGLYTSYAQTGYSLDQCKKLALENNNQVKNSNLELLASKQIKKSAFTSYFPKVSGSAIVYRFNEPLLNIDFPGGNLPVYDGNPVNLLTPTQFAYFPGVSMSMIDNGYIGTITAIQPVFAGGRIITGNNLAKVGVDASTSRLVLSKYEVQLKTEENYWLIVSLNEKKKTLTMVEQLLDTIYNEANDAYNAGLINRNDVLKVTLKQSDARISRMKLENGIKLASMAFCQHLGIPYDESMILTDTIGISQSPAEVYINGVQALQNREEYKLLEYSIKAEEFKSRMKIGEYLPQVGVGVGTLYYDIQDEGTFNSMIFASISVPISGWWDASHSMKARKYQEEITRNNSKNNSELLLLQIQKSWNELEESYQQIEVVRETVTQAEESLKINRDNYKAGIVNISDMLEAQAMVQQTKDNLADALSGYKVKLVKYLQVTGRY
ncbi:MAG: TolC family protein [Bacteroidales bacterium]|nr:TolC family protein [Bacteroidales bacterium]